MNNGSIIQANVDDYISSFPEEVRLKLNQIRSLIKRLVPEVEESISYGMPSYKYRGILTYFSAYKNHIGMFAVPDLHPDFVEKFKPYKTGRGSVQFPLKNPLPLDFIEEIIKFRLKDNRSNI